MAMQRTAIKIFPEREQNIKTNIFLANRINLQLQQKLYSEEKCYGFSAHINRRNHIFVDPKPAGLILALPFSFPE